MMSENTDDNVTKNFQNKLSSDLNYNVYLGQRRKEFYSKFENCQPSPEADFSVFEKLITLGEGAFGLVKLFRHINTEKYYAVKIVLKSRIMKYKQLDHIIYEKKILQSINFTFLVTMEFSLKDNVAVYLGMPFITGGEMFGHLRNEKKFNEYRSKFYAAQVVLALEYLHYLDIVYRDLKPENIMTCVNGYIKMIDMGFCKIVPGRTWTLCGTPEYIAPEIIQSKGYGKAVDWWSFGVLIYEMVAGVSPFYVPADDPMVMYNRITSGKYKLPGSFSSDLKHLINNLLQVELSKRFGNLKNGVQDIKTHCWFKNINWIGVYNQELEAPFLPTVQDITEIGVLDQISDNKGPKSTRCEYEDQFRDF